MKSIDICIVSPWLLEARTKRGGGIEEIDYQIAHGLSKFYKIIILSPYYPNYEKCIHINDNFEIGQINFPAIKNYPPKSDMELLMISLSMPIYSILLAIRVFNLRDKQLKLIIVHNGLLGLISTMIAKFLKIKVIYSEGNTTPWVNPCLSPRNKAIKNKFTSVSFPFSGILIASLSDYVRTQSRSIKDGMVQSGICPDKIYIIPGGVSTKIIEPIKNTSIEDIGKIRVGFIGRLTDEKGVPLLIEVIQKALRDLPDISFIIMGDGPYRESIARFKNVEYVGFVNRDEINTWFAKVQIMVFLQKDAGLGLLEALAAGKAIISSDVGDVPDIIKHLYNGVLCQPHAEDYIRCIETICRDSNLLKRLSENARKTALESFSWDIVLNEWLKLYQMVLNIYD